MQLSKRLTAIANMVRQGNRVVDVGCDHGYIPIWLVEQKRVPSALAMDINKGPLQRAAANIEQHGLSGYIQTRLSDGLKALKSKEGDTLVIAGMGGPLTERILEEGEEVLRSFEELILEPQSEIGHVRQFLQNHNYRIEEEDMVYEDGKFYPIMRVVHGHMESLKPEETKYGPKLLENKNPVLHKFLMCELHVKENLSHDLLRIQSEKAAGRLLELWQELSVIHRALEYYK